MSELESNSLLWRPEESGASWIFPDRSEDCVNQLVDFLHIFDCENPEKDAVLRISADTDFVVWLNGKLIGYGQYSDYPDQKTYEQFCVGNDLIQGKNSLAVTVFYNGRTSSVYRRGQAGVVFAIGNEKTLAASGTDTFCRQNPCYHSGPIATVSGQLFYTFGYDARGTDDFNRKDYSPGDDWAAIQESEATKPSDRSELKPRPISRLEEQGLTPCRLHSTGIFRRDLSLAEKQFESTAREQTTAGLYMSDGKLVSPAWLMQHDLLSPLTSFEMFGCPRGKELTDEENGLKPKPDICKEDEGIYIIIDMGQQEVGYLDFDIEAPAGTTLDIGYGEHLEDLRVRTWVGSRSFADRYICREGRQQFVHHFQRWAGRYLAIHADTADLTLYRINLQRRAYPVTIKGSLKTGDQLHNRIIDVAQRTLHLCMHEHYEDTPWREQALYANDARTQALCGYYAFGETAFPRSSFSLLGRGLRDDGFIHLTAPAMPGLTIPSFTFCWMLAVRDHYLYSGDDSLAAEFLPQIRSMLKAFLEERKDSLLPLRHVKGIWHFYDWSGMSGYSDEDFEKGLVADAPLNCFLILALQAANQIMSWLGEQPDPEFSKAIDEIRNAVNNKFWNPELELFQTHKNEAKYTQLTQALTVLAGVGTAKQHESVLSQMVDPDSELIEPGLSQTLYTFSALMTKKELFGEAVLRGIEKTWGIMLDAGATTFWETIKGASDFHNAGSLCHAWSAVPVYVYFHDLLGIEPLEPGFRKFTVDPIQTYVPVCSGKVPVPGGEISLEWKKEGETYEYSLDAPEQCKTDSSLERLPRI